MIALTELVQFLDQFFLRYPYPDDLNGIYHPSDRPIQRIGLALDPFVGLPDWMDTHQIDALFLHRPWKLELESIASNISIISYHLAFDERLTLGLNLRLAEVLNLIDPHPFGYKENRPIGMIGKILSQEFDRYIHQINQVFDGYESILGNLETVSKVAIVGAMNDALVREAAHEEVDLYLTGQFRVSAKQAVSETGLGVIEIGHRRSEHWGLRALAGILRERWANVQVIIAENDKLLTIPNSEFRIDVTRHSSDLIQMTSLKKLAH